MEFQHRLFRWVFLAMYKLSTTLLAIGFLVFVNVLNSEVDSETTCEKSTPSEKAEFLLAEDASSMISEDVKITQYI
ncbi:MAG: hypothetical protein F4039_05435 [Gammaproteobacteria bacterium]|nr:hypothetical protein [Gammaproteobacteria bacterium]MYK43509.1 hypothetical protein [Gammaproteobacteria bacterium]